MDESTPQPDNRRKAIIGTRRHSLYAGLGLFALCGFNPATKLPNPNYKGQADTSPGSPPTPTTGSGEGQVSEDEASSEEGSSVVSPRSGRETSMGSETEQSTQEGENSEVELSLEERFPDQVITCENCGNVFHVERTIVSQLDMYCPKCLQKMDSESYYKAGGKSDWICRECGARPCICD